MSALSGRRVVVTAGPTFEDLDPVRFLGNRSSGKMGFAVASAAAARGADVLLIAGPVTLPTPPDIKRIDVRSAAQMHAAVMAALPCDVYIGAAAVADYTPVSISPNKLKKQPGQDGLTLTLVRTRDILAEVAAHPKRPQLVVGFAAETHDVETYARGKLVAKKVDLIAANRVGVEGSGFESDENTLVVYDTDASTTLGPGAKSDIAGGLLDLIEARLA
ncbi:phosphopantothenoylcysteine decarboxylase/phosphopantothenate--cysteine ligase [Lysobacter sp. HA18]